MIKHAGHRTKVMLSRKKMHGILTKITLKSAANKDGIAYSTPIFEVVGTLSADETQRVQQYASGFDKAMRGAVSEEPRSNTQPSTTAVAPNMGRTDIPVSGISDDDELPFD